MRLSHVHCLPNEKGSYIAIVLVQLLGSKVESILEDPMFVRAVFLSHSVCLHAFFLASCPFIWHILLFIYLYFHLAQLSHISLLKLSFH